VGLGGKEIIELIGEITWSAEGVGEIGMNQRLRGVERHQIGLGVDRIWFDQYLDS